MLRCRDCLILLSVIALGCALATTGRYADRGSLQDGRRSVGLAPSRTSADFQFRAAPPTLEESERDFLDGLLAFEPLTIEGTLPPPPPRFPIRPAMPPSPDGSRPLRC